MCLGFLGFLGLWRAKFGVFWFFVGVLGGILFFRGNLGVLFFRGFGGVIASRFF